MAFTELDKKQVAEKRLGFTVFLHIFMLLGASVYPEGSFFKWLFINLAIECLIVIRILSLWKQYKFDTKRYYSLQVYWMLTGFSIFSVIPFVKTVYGTTIFWLLLIITIGMFIAAHLLKERIGAIFVNPGKLHLLVLWPKLLAVIVLIGIVIMAVLRAQSYHSNVGLFAFLYLIGMFALYTAVPFSLTEERIEKLKST
ncbi:magnesium-transporting ATPase (P-type) [Sporosarcina luteola]|nr:magnesium-transporting ATPase (P-type) [Sporosarcina luteola]